MMIMMIMVLIILLVIMIIQRLIININNNELNTMIINMAIYKRAPAGRCAADP